MRELEFLPAWYPRLRRRKRLVAVQVWALLMLVAGLGSWMALATRNVEAAEQDLDALGASLAQTQGQLLQLDDLLTLEKQQRYQMQVLERLGTHVEAARMLKMLEELMPPEMAVLDLSMQVGDESVRAAAAAAGSNLLAAAGLDRTAAGGAVVERRLRVRLTGVTPTDVDLANFLARLGNGPFFEQVAMSYAKDRSDAGHMMREFEVTFAVPLGRTEAALR